LFQWWLTNIGFAGDIYYAILANAFIHLIMYYYYLVSTVTAPPKWGKYLTQMQMVQFVTMLYQATYLLVNDCAYPKIVLVVYITYIISLLILFLNFYLGKHNVPKKDLVKKAE
jgi:elongation of very long chain fatty acids protein 4